MLAGGVHERYTLAWSGVTARPVGALGAVICGGDGAVGVADATADAGPVPAELTALIRNWYMVSFAKPVTVVLVPVPAPSANSPHEMESAALYSTT